MAQRGFHDPATQLHAQVVKRSLGKVREDNLRDKPGERKEQAKRCKGPGKGRARKAAAKRGREDGQERCIAGATDDACHNSKHDATQRVSKQKRNYIHNKFPHSYSFISPCRERRCETHWCNVGRPRPATTFDLRAAASRIG